jgi:hypothetical protein
MKLSDKGPSQPSLPATSRDSNHRHYVMILTKPTHEGARLHHARPRSACLLEMHARNMHAYEVHACEMHIYEVHTLEMHACEMHACEVHACEQWSTGLGRAGLLQKACPAHG